MVWDGKAAMSTAIYGANKVASEAKQVAANDPVSARLFDLKRKIDNYVDSFGESPREVFLYEIGKHFGGLRTVTVGQFEVPIPEVPGGPIPEIVIYPVRQEGKVITKQIQASSELKLIDWYYRKGKKPEFASAGVIILPLTEYRVAKERLNPARRYSFKCSVLRESSYTKGAEVYIDVSISGDIPLGAIKKVPVKLSAKVGGKGSLKWEKKETTRNAFEVSSSFTVKDLLHNVIVFSSQGSRLRPEYGYMIHRDLVGDTFGPFWPDYDFLGDEETDSALDKRNILVTRLIEAAAQDAVREAAGQGFLPDMPDRL